MELSTKTTSAEKVVNFVFLIILNIAIISIIGFMTLDINATLNSRVGGLLLSIFIPVFLVYQSKQISGLERMIKFGFGIFTYLIAASIIVGIPVAFTSWLMPCLVIALGVLFYGGKLTSRVLSE